MMKNQTTTIQLSFKLQKQVNELPHVSWIGLSP